MKITACWIAKNEEANIRRSIESVADVADELIVVDTGSTDGTVKLCESLGARVDYFEWISDFAAARNYAISLVTGDYVIFLDADEWFEPRLGPSGRDMLVELFTKNPKLDCVSVVIKNVDRLHGASIDTSVVNRIFANNGKIRYKGRVHEHLDGVENVVTLGNLCLLHSGYSKDVISSKLERNVGLLEAAFKDSAEGSQNWIRFQMYLIRESHHSGQVKKAAEYLKSILKYPGVIKKLCVFHNEEFVGGVYIAIAVAFKERASVNRRDIYKKLFALFKQVYPNYPGTAESELMYQAFFDMKEDRFLREFGPAMSAAERMRKPESVTYYKDYERFMYEKAALAAWRRMDRLNAMEYSIAALKSGGKHHNNPLLAILLTAIKDQPAQDIVLFLNTIYNITVPADLDFLINRIRIDGFQDVYSYYAKKRMDSGAVRTEDYLCLMLVHKKYDAAASAAAESYAAGNKAAAQYLFLAAICGASPEIIRAYAGILEGYTHILDAYNSGQRLTAITNADVSVLQNTYSITAFAAGFETAEKLLAVFRAVPNVCFSIKASYCETANCLEWLLDEDMTGIGKTDIMCRQNLIQAMILANRYDEALAEIENFLNAEVIEQIIIHILLVIAEKAGGSAGAKARALYDRYMAVYDSLIDLDDVVRTGVAVEDEKEKEIQKPALKRMTRAELDRVIKGESERFAVPKLLELSRKAADVYKQNRLMPEAIRCICRLIAHGAATEVDRESLAEIFGGVKNKELAEYVKSAYKR